MPRQASQLDDNALLLLYVSDELSDAQREGFDQRLASEPQLVERLNQLRAAQMFCFDALEKEDRRLRLPAGELVTARNVARAMQQWRIDRMVAPPEPVRHGLLPLPRWSYPAAIAAMLFIGFVVWSSGRQVDRIASNVTIPDREQQDLADWIDSSFGVSAEANAATVDTAFSPPAALMGSDDSGPSPYSSPEETVE